MGTATEQGVRAPLLMIQRGGWSAYFPHIPHPNGGGSKSTLSHYGTTWREHYERGEFTDDALLIGTKSVPGALIYTLAVGGPMVDVDVPAGMIRKSFTNELVPWDSRPQAHRGEDFARFGNAHGLDFVAIDVHATIVAEFGGDVLTVAHAYDTNYDPREG